MGTMPGYKEENREEIMVEKLSNLCYKKGVLGMVLESLAIIDEMPGAEIYRAEARYALEQARDKLFKKVDALGSMAV